MPQYLNQLGTAHAVRQALPLLEGFEGRVIVLYGDTPFIGAETLDVLAAHPSDVVVLGFEAADPGRYGRLVTGPEGLERIVEYKDADEATRAIRLVNSGVLAADAATLREFLPRIGNRNAAGEYYLTDLPGLARAAGRRVDVVTCDEAETLGINTRAELAGAEAAFQARARAQALEDGVTLSDPATVWFALDTAIGRDAVIGQNVRIYQAVTLGAKRFPKDAQGHLQKGWARHPIVEDDVVIYAGATILGRVTIGKGAVIGGNVWITDDVAPAPM